jgi:DNA-binding CsgD family transcriptional regulator
VLRDEAHFHSVIEHFRQAALGEACWEATMCLLSDVTNAASANLVGVHDGRVQFAWTNNLDPVIWDDLGEAMNNIELNPRLRAASKAAPFQRVEGYDFGSDGMTRRFPVFGEACRKHDVGFGSLMNLEMTGRDFVGLALLRNEKQGHGAPEDGLAMSVLAPYLMDAVRLRRSIEDQGALIARGAMEQIKATVFLCNSWGRVVAMTSAAEDLVGPGGPLALRNGVLTCCSPVATRRLADAITMAARKPGSSMQTVVLEARTGERMTAEIGRLPVPAGALDYAPRVIVTMRRKKPPPPVELIAAALDLTAAEAAVAHGLASGWSRAEIAARRGASLETVRAQLKAIFAKLDLSREVELVVRVLEIA